MGRRGPRPGPNAMKILRGNPGKRRVVDCPRPEADEQALPRAPAWLDAEAKVKWKELVPQLERMGVLARIDRDALARYCDTWAWWRRMRAFIDQKGETYLLRDDEGKPKYIQQLPQVAIAHKLATQLTRLEAEFGLTPAARSSIHLTVAPDRPLDAFERMRAEGRSIIARIGDVS